MGVKLKYRWMQKKDLGKLQEHKSFKSLLKDSRTIANVVEGGENILGYVVYEILNKKIKIIKISFLNNEIFDFIIDKIKSKFSYTIEIAACEYNLDFQLLLKDSNFIAKKIEKINQDNFYIFELDPK